MPRVRPIAATETATLDPEAPAAAPPPQPIELTPQEPPKGRRDLDGLDYLRALAPGEWNDRLAYVYRQDPNIVKADPKAKLYIAKFAAAFDEEDIKQKFGGGRFLVILKNLRGGDGKAEKMFSFDIEGPPKIQPDEKTITAPAATAAAAPAPAGVVDQNQLFAFAREIMAEARRSRDLPEDEALARVTATMQKGTEAIIDVMRGAMETRANSGTGNPMMDRLIEAAVTRLAGAGDPMASFNGFLGALNQLGLGAALRPQNPLGVLKDIRDSLGIDIASALKGGGGRSDWKQALLDAAPSILEQLNGALDRFSRIQRQNFEIALATHRERQAGRGMVAAQPANLEIEPAPIAPTPPPAMEVAPEAVLPRGFTTGAPVAVEPAPPKTLDLESLLRLIVRHFKGGKAGDFVGSLLMEVYPEHVPVFRAFLADASQLVAQAKENPILAEIAADAEFPQFAQELVAELAGEPPARA